MPVVTIQFEGTGRERVAVELNGRFRYTSWNVTAQKQQTTITVTSGADLVIFVPEYLENPMPNMPDFVFQGWTDGVLGNRRTISNIIADQTIVGTFAGVPAPPNLMPIVIGVGAAVGILGLVFFASKMR